MSGIVRDVRYGLRVLARSRIFTAVAVASLALGIGANAAIFHLLDALTLRSLPVARPHELVEVRPDDPQAFGNYDNADTRRIRRHQCLHLPHGTALRRPTAASVYRSRRTG